MESNPCRQGSLQVTPSPGTHFSLFTLFHLPVLSIGVWFVLVPGPARPLACCVPHPLNRVPRLISNATDNIHTLSPSLPSITHSPTHHIHSPIDAAVGTHWTLEKRNDSGELVWERGHPTHRTAEKKKEGCHRLVVKGDRPALTDQLGDTFET